MPQISVAGLANQTCERSINWIDTPRGKGQSFGSFVMDRTTFGACMGTVP